MTFNNARTISRDPGLALLAVYMRKTLLWLLTICPIQRVFLGLIEKTPVKVAECAASGRAREMLVDGNIVPI